MNILRSLFLCATLIGSSYAGIIWNLAYRTNPTSSDIYQLAAHDSTYLLQGSGGRAQIYVSHDLDHWKTFLSNDRYESLERFLWADGYFIGRTNFDRIHQSVNGKDWAEVNTDSLRSKITSQSLDFIQRRNDTLFATADSGKIFILPPNSNWKLVSALGKSIESFVLTDDTLYVLDNSRRIYRSNNNLDWKMDSISSSNRFDQLEIVNGKLYVFGSSCIWHENLGKVFTSPNSYSYEMNGSPIGFITYTSPNKVFISSDGINWTSSIINFVRRNETIATVKYQDSLFYILGKQGSLLTSKDAINWKDHSTKLGDMWSNCLEKDSSLVCLGSEGVLAEFDRNFNLVRDTLTQFINTQDYLYSSRLGKYIAVGSKDYKGTIWIADSMLGTPTITKIAEDVLYEVNEFDSILVAISGWSRYLGGGIYTSKDGVKWDTSFVHNWTTVMGIISDGKQYIAASSDGLMVSTDLKTWTTLTIDNDPEFTGITYHKGRYVAVCEGGYAYYSDNLADWTQTRFNRVTETYISVNEDLFTVDWFDSSYIAFGEYGSAIQSPDGITWTEFSLGDKSTFYETSILSDRLLIFATEGQIFQGIRTKPALGIEPYHRRQFISGKSRVNYDLLGRRRLLD